MTNIDFSSDHHRGGTKAAQAQDERTLAELTRERERLLEACSTPVGRAARVLASYFDSSPLGVNKATTAYVRRRMSSRERSA